jgi:hypothetical protein
MYYEEKIINGVLCWRTDPKDEFAPYTIEELSSRVVSQGARIEAAVKTLRDGVR